MPINKLIVFEKTGASELNSEGEVLKTIF
jgi:hypothetical protein